ncbi:hypothetical protein SDJN03_21419, partial [Cucurbita argyrosperma subsp. sororia]
MDDAIDRKKTKKRRAFSIQRLRDSWKWKFLKDFKWKRLNLHIGFLDAIIFRIASLFEAIALIGIAGFFSSSVVAVAASDRFCQLNRSISMFFIITS